MKGGTERGSSSLAFVLLLFSFGMLMLNGLQQQHRRQQVVVASETEYLKQYSAAVSALAWGTQRRWSNDSLWQCQQQALQWRACVKTIDKKRSLMAAQRQPQTAGNSPLVLWRWGKIENTRWISASHGWADFCPFTQASQCLLPE